MSASIAIPVAMKAKQKASQFVQESTGYDFLNLFQGLVIIFLIAKAIELYVQVAKGVSSGWISVIKLFGFQAPTNVPSALDTLVSTGFSGIKYWDIIKGLMILIVIYEWSKAKDRLNSSGQLAFGMISAFLILITIPSLSQRLKEMKILSKVA